jgi:4-amino-4-deoxy-L-arabinose transferase-like glycosyltransferase
MLLFSIQSQKNFSRSKLRLKRWCGFAAILSGFFFLLAGQLFVARLGFQADEALFTGPWFEPLSAIDAIHTGHRVFPLMLMSYLGTLKTLLLWPVFKRFGTGVYPIRESCLSIGAFSIVLFYLIIRRVAGSFAAVIGCVTLGADSLYLLTACFDWGPVAFQHLLVAAGAYCWVRFFQSGSRVWIALGGFVWGLALWDKALAVWLLAGLAAATVLTARQKLGALRLDALALAAATCAAGASPLILYNVRNGGATFRENAGWTLDQFPQKVNMLRITSTGAALFGYLSAEDKATPAPHRTPDWLANIPEAQESLLPYAFGLALLLAPLGGADARRAIAFCLIALAVAWLAMAINPHAGGSAHHVILLWPLPQAIIGISFAAASRRTRKIGAPLAAAATAVLCLSCLLVTAGYYRKIVRNGAPPNWSAAVFPMAESLRNSGAQEVYAMDWGILDTVRLINRNVPLMRNGVAGLNEHDVTAEGRLFVTHAEGAVVLPDVDAQAVKAAAAFGYRRETVGVWTDGYGRDIFEVYRWAKRD